MFRIMIRKNKKQTPKTSPIKNWKNLVVNISLSKKLKINLEETPKKELKKADSKLNVIILSNLISKILRLNFL